MEAIAVGADVVC